MRPRGAGRGYGVRGVQDEHCGALSGAGGRERLPGGDTTEIDGEGERRGKTAPTRGAELRDSGGGREDERGGQKAANRGVWEEFGARDRRFRLDVRL